MADTSSTKTVTQQAVLYFIFAGVVIILNLAVQSLHMNFISPWVCAQFSWPIIQTYYCPQNGRVLAGSILGVGISYVVKFILDKFIVFEKKDTNLKQTSKEFTKYFLFAIVTTLINIGGQYLLYAVFGIDYIIAGFISLAIGYVIKFLLDRKYVFMENTGGNYADKASN